MKREYLVSIILALSIALFALPAAAFTVDGDDLGFVSYTDSDGDGVLEVDDGPPDPLPVKCVSAAGDLCEACPEGADETKKDLDGNIIVDSCTGEIFCADPSGEVCSACPEGTDLSDPDEYGRVEVTSCDASISCVDTAGALCASCPEGAEAGEIDSEGNFIVEACPEASGNESNLPGGDNFLDASDGCSLAPGAGPSAMPLLMSLMGAAALAIMRRRK
ncbi:MAG TPA: hypothetical protein PLY45_04925 [bacterium]|nr:hypothetical protein [bacterium]